MGESNTISDDLSAEIISKKKKIVESLLSWAEKNPQRYPWRHTDNPYNLLIAEMLLQKTKADSVSQTYVEFIKKFPSIETLFRTDESIIKKKIESLGLGNTRTRRIKKIATAIHCSFKSEISEENFHRVLGESSPYLLNSLRCFAFGQPSAIFDVNVKRILERVFGLDFGKNAHRNKMAWQISKMLLPTENFKQYNWALLDLGRLICVSKNPKCKLCPLKHNCKFSLQQRLPG